MKKKLGFSSDAGTFQVNLSGDTDAWNGACLSFAETAHVDMGAGHGQLHDCSGDFGYAANLSPATLDWNGSCLNFNLKDH